MTTTTFSVGVGRSTKDRLKKRVGLSFGHTSSYKLQTSIPTNGDTDEKWIKETRLDNSARS
jgi:long-subunit fatty acid transport protein